MLVCPHCGHDTFTQRRIATVTTTCQVLDDESLIDSFEEIEAVDDSDTVLCDDCLEHFVITDLVPSAEYDEA